MLFFANFIPMLIFAPVAGVVADRYDRKLILICIRSMIAVLGAVMAVLILSGVATPGVLVGMAFLLGTTYGFMGPAQSAAVANTVPREAIMGAVSMASAGNNLCRIAGPALAAPILAIWGTGWAFVVYSASSALVAILLVPIHLTATLNLHDDSGMWRRMLDGLRHARDRPPAIHALITMCVFSIFGAAQMALYPLFASDVHDKPTRAFTYDRGRLGGRRRRRRDRQRLPAHGAEPAHRAALARGLQRRVQSALRWPALGRAVPRVRGRGRLLLLLDDHRAQHDAATPRRRREARPDHVAVRGDVGRGDPDRCDSRWASATEPPARRFVVAFGASVCLVFALVQLRVDSHLGEPSAVDGTAEVGRLERTGHVLGAPVSCTLPDNMIDATSATPSTWCANCSTTTIESPSLAMRCDDRVEVVDDQRREAHRELVEQQHLRVDGQRAGHREHLLLAARQRARELLAPLGQAWEPREGAVEHVCAAACPAYVAMRRFSVTVRFGKTPRPSGHEAEASTRQRVGPGLADAHAVEQHLAGVGADLPARHLERGGLARAVGPEQRVHLTRRQHEVDAVEDVDGAVAGEDLAQLQRGRGHRLTRGFGRVVDAGLLAHLDRGALVSASTTSARASTSASASGSSLLRLLHGVLGAGAEVGGPNPGVGLDRRRVARPR